MNLVFSGNAKVQYPAHADCVPVDGRTKSFWVDHTRPIKWLGEPTPLVKRTCAFSIMAGWKYPAEQSELYSQKPQICQSRTVRFRFIPNRGTFRPGKIAYNRSAGEVLELADRRDLGSRAERREGSSPSFPTFTRSGAQPVDLSALGECMSSVRTRLAAYSRPFSTIHYDIIPRLLESYKGSFQPEIELSNGNRPLHSVHHIQVDLSGSGLENRLRAPR